METFVSFLFSLCYISQTLTSHASQSDPHPSRNTFCCGIQDCRCVLTFISKHYSFTSSPSSFSFFATLSITFFTLLYSKQTTLIPFLSHLLNIFQTHRSANDTIAWVSLSSPMRASARFWSQNSTYFPAGPKIILSRKSYFSSQR